MMVTESPVKLPVTLPNGRTFEGFEMNVGALLRENQQKRNKAALDRSGSAPPTVEGSRNAMGSLFGNPSLVEVNRIDGGKGGGLSEEEILSHPAYLSFYYSSENFNHRLPPPALSKEDWRVSQRAAAAASFGRIGDGRRKEFADSNGSSKSLFALQPSLPGHPVHDGEGELGEFRIGAQRSLTGQPLAEWIERGSGSLAGLTGGGLEARRKSFVNALQDERGRTTSVSGHLLHPMKGNVFDDVVDPRSGSDAQLVQLQNGLETVASLRFGATSPGLVRVQTIGSSVSHSFASVLSSSQARSSTPDLVVGRSPSLCLPPVQGNAREMPSNGVSTSMADPVDIAVAFSDLSLSHNRILNEVNHVQPQELADQPEFVFNMANDHGSYLHQNIKREIESMSIPSMPYNDYYEKNSCLTDLNVYKLTSNGHFNLPKRSSESSHANLHIKQSALGSASPEGSSSPYQHADLLNIDFTESNGNDFPSNLKLQAMMNSQMDAGVTWAGVAEGQYPSRSGGHLVSGFQVPIMDPQCAQYLQGSDFAAQEAASLSDPSLGRNYNAAAYIDMPGYPKAYLGALLAHQKLQCGIPFLGESGGLNHGYYDSSAFGIGMPYPAKPAASPLRQSERLSCFPSMIRSSTAGSMGSRNSENGAMEEGFASSLLEEFKSNKTRTFELSDIIEHVVEFSVDQYGSRFIQQKLETDSSEEKNKIFPEILPHARALMTDVFGNYVIQKFFEHGTESQRKQLASQLTGHVLPLSLQMYGCRVIQKALEVVDVDQQTQMVSELDVSVMKCVRDQNGNHVIQKCIECVPQERIQFIISSFYGQVVVLSTHPYGCRVIQRVLEHCDDKKTQSIMMDEILQSVCDLAQDQYGNYVVQHILQHGKQQERSAIIKKLGGQIVKMSQQKFASNVVEKCLAFGSPEDRQNLINEMLGSTDENEPLQAMMKDQFANYVVQKVLETCDDHNRELILSRIKVHLNALKRYTYGKHIVARVEKLIATGGEKGEWGLHPLLIECQHLKAAHYCTDEPKALI